MQTQAIIWCNAYNYLYERNKGCISVAELDSGVIKAYKHKYIYIYILTAFVLRIVHLSCFFIKKNPAK